MTREDKKFPVLLGFIDGMLTALTLCTGKLLEGGARFDLSFVFRVSLAAFITGIFVYFVAKYAELRGQLIQAEKELNLTLSGKLASTALGKQVLRTAMIDAAVSGVGGFMGAFVPLLVAVVDPYVPWITFLFSIVILGIFGFGLGKMVGKRPVVWSIAHILGGILVIFFGIELHIVS